jgi:hypothetical protein
MQEENEEDLIFMGKNLFITYVCNPCKVTSTMDIHSIVYFITVNNKCAILEKQKVVVSNIKIFT